MLGFLPGACVLALACILYQLGSPGHNPLCSIRPHGATGSGQAMSCIHASNASAARFWPVPRSEPGYLRVEVINNTEINKQALPGNNSERGNGQNRAADALLAWIEHRCTVRMNHHSTVAFVIKQLIRIRVASNDERGGGYPSGSGRVGDSEN